MRGCESYGMRAGVSSSKSATDRKAVCGDGGGSSESETRTQKHVWPSAHIVLLTAADGCSTAEYACAATRTFTRRLSGGGRSRFHDRPATSKVCCATTRFPSVAHPASAGAVEQSVVAVSAHLLADPPGETTHWTAAATAQESGISGCEFGAIPHLAAASGGGGIPTAASGAASSAKAVQRPPFASKFASKLRGCPDCRALCRSSPARIPSCCRSMKRARSRRWKALSQACP